MYFYFLKFSMLGINLFLNINLTSLGVFFNAFTCGLVHSSGQGAGIESEGLFRF